MITRRGFIIASGTTLGALSLTNAAAALTGANATTTIASQTRVLPPAAQGAQHIALTGERMKDLATLEHVFAQGTAAEIELHIDTTDRVLLDIALTRVQTPYLSVADAQGSIRYRRSSVFGV